MNAVLEPKHLEDLRKSGLTDASIDAYDFSSVTAQEVSKLLLFPAPSGGWTIRYPKIDFLKFKPDRPYTTKNKYLSPRFMSQRLFITHLAEKAMFNINEPYYFCEGEKKCILLEQEGYASISVPGVWGWVSHGHTIEDFTQINIPGRTCYILFDSDKYNNKHVLDAEKRISAMLTGLTAKVKIVNFNPDYGKGADDQFLKLGKKGFTHYLINAIDFDPKQTLHPTFFPPLSLPEFLEKDIPIVEYYIENMICKNGKTMISAQTNIGKSIFVQNLSLSMTTQKTNFLDRFTVTSANVLYLDLEMGESALKQRFQVLCQNEQAPGLFVKFMPDANFLEPDVQALIEDWIVSLKINVLVIDPIGNAWSGDENNKQEVQALTTYLNTLITKHNLSIVAIHHWRKATKDFKGGGEMAAGSYKWAAWLDYHLTLSGSADSITVSCEKSRHGSRFKPFLARINNENLRFEYLTDFEKKFTEDTLIQVFNFFNKTRVSISEIIKHVKDEKICSEKTLRKLVKESNNFTIDSSQKCHYLERKNELFDESQYESYTN